MKRIVAVFLCIAMLLTTVPSVSAASTTDKEMKKKASSIYRKSLRSSGKSSFHGYCGAFVSHQLYNLRINRWLSTHHGKDHFDYYSGMEKTSGGYFIRSYSVTDFSLPDALNYITDNGTRDVYNVMVGFERTDTSAGKKYGHVVLIYGIVGGAVYFSESYYMAMNGRGYPEGSLIKCSIADFAAYYEDWTQYEGISVFGTKSYTDVCQEEGTNLMVQTRFDTVLRSQPCQVGINESKLLRNISAGERLQATGVFTNTENELFYRIADGDLVGYVSASAVCVLQANAFNSVIEELSLPKVLPVGQDAELSGAVVGAYAKVHGVKVQLVDAENQVLQELWWENNANQCKLDLLNDKLKFEELSEGFYTLKISGDVKCVTADGDVLEASALLGGTHFQVGGEQFISRAMPALTYQEEPDVFGWMYQDGWYFYDGEEPKTGWFTWCGVQYFFDELGRAVTGWVTLEDQLHYFSATGALVKNSQLTRGKTVYQIDDLGVATKIKK